MKRPMIIMLVVVGLFFGGLFGWKAFVGMQMQQAMQATPLPAATVSTTIVTTATWTPSINAVGSLRAVQGVDVTAQVAGLITELHFDSGATVAAGDLLVQQYTADEQAQLEGRIAERQLADLNFVRAQNLVKQKLISDFDFDASKTELTRAKAAETDLRLKIEQKSIRAPFAGRVGLRNVDLGQYIEPGDTIIRLEAVEKILADFPVPQRRVSDLHVGQAIDLQIDAWPGERFAGVISAIEPQVARDTRNIEVRAVIDNSDGRLVPGMFVLVGIRLPAQEQVITVPQSAITYSPYGNSVYVVEEQLDEAGAKTLRVANTFVVTGATRGDQAVISSGLEAGMTIVTAGQQKLRNGAQVVVDNTVPVSNNPDPRPSNN